MNGHTMNRIIRTNIWLVVTGTMEFLMTFHILGVILPTDFHIFQRGRSTTNQILSCRNHVFPLFPTCQVRVVRFYQSCSPPPPRHPPPPPRSPDPSGHCRTSTASSRSQWALPDLNRELQIPVGTAGPQPRAPDPSGHCRTSTAR